MVDRLNSLRFAAGINSPALSYGTTSDNAAGGGGTVMDELTELHSIINPLLNNLKQDITMKIKLGTKEATLATSPEKERKIGQKINCLIEKGKSKILEVKGVLEQIKTIQTEEAGTMTPAETQMCSTVISSSSRLFKKNLSDYLKAQEDYRAAVKGKVSRQLRICYPEANSNEIAELANEDPASVRAAINAQMQKGGGGTVQQTLKDLHEKYSDLKKLEDSVLELRDLFIYLAALVEEQGAKLDSIEIHVENTREYTGQAVLQLEKAKEHKDSYDTKRMWMYILSSLGVIAVVIAICMCIGPFLTTLRCVTGN